MSTDSARRTSTRTYTEQLADFFADLRYEDIPSAVIERARLGILDTIGCGLVGTTAEEGRRVLAAARVFDQGDGATIWGTQERASVPAAALVNGTMAHALELDDIGGPGHPGTFVVTTALAIGETVGASGRDLLTAVVTGYELGFRISEGVGGYTAISDRGWHGTGTIGSFAAAAAAAKLLGLDAEGFADALGIAGSFTGGTWAFIADGAMTKRLHAGKAAETGVIAAYLAQQGFTGPRKVLEAEWGGMFNVYIPGKANPPAMFEGLGSVWHTLECGFKRHACCAGIHPPLDTLLDLMGRHELNTDVVDHIDVIASPYSVRQLGKQEADSFCDAQLSVPYTLAAAFLSGGRTGPDQYTEERLRNPEVRAWAHRVTMYPDESIQPRDPHVVRVYRADGTVVEGSVAVPKGRPENPLSAAEIEAKFRNLAAAALPEETVSRIVAMVGDLEQVDSAAQLTQLLVGSGQHAEVAAGG
jgi:2-methylcitrate dehydratase PrpD